MTSNNEDPTMQADDTDRDDGHDGEEPAMEPDTQMSETMKPGAQAPETAEKRKGDPQRSGGSSTSRVAERAARGKAARAEVPRASHGDWEPAAPSAGPGRAARGAGADARARARPDPLRPHARLAVHVLPRRRLPDGVRSRRRPADRPAHAALRRRAPVELRRLRRARPASWSSASTTSTRRCPARSSGTSSASSRASPSPGRDRGFDEKQRAEINREVVRSYRENIRDVRRDAQPRPLVLADRRRRDLAPRSSSEAKAPRQREALRGERRQGTDEGQHEGVREADDDRRRRAADHGRPAADRPDRGRRRRPDPPPGRVPPRASSAPTGARSPATGASCSSAFGTSTPPARSSASAASARARGSASCSGATATTRCSSSSRRRSRRCSEPFLGKSRVREQRPAGRRRPAPDPGGERHHARLDQDRGRRRRQARLLHPPALGRQDVGSGRVHGAASMFLLRAASAGPSSPAPTCGRATASRSRATSAAGDTFDRALATFAESYADQNERDYAALKTAVEVGRVQRRVRAVAPPAPHQATHVSADRLGLHGCRSAPDRRRHVVAAALFAAGCGGSSDDSSGASPTEEWADGLCSAITTWTSSLTSIGDSLKERQPLEGLAHERRRRREERDRDVHLRPRRPRQARYRSRASRPRTRSTSSRPTSRPT